jgi:ABC-type transport system substrate-binding protein
MHRKLPIFYLIFSLSALPGLPVIEEVRDPVVILDSSSQNIFRFKAFGDTFLAQLDPIHPDATVFVSEQLFDGLVSLDAELNPTPALADYWHVDHEGLFHRFMLRKGVRFHHGAELTAEDVKFSLERILDPDNRSPYAGYFLDRVAGAREFHSGRAREVSGFEAMDRYTFRIQWTRPYAMALSLLSMPFCKILPRDLVLEQGRGFFQKPAGTGPFMFEEWVRDNRLEIVGVKMARNPGYYKGTPQLEYVAFCPNYRLEDFYLGDVHAIPVVEDKLLQGEYQIFRDGSIFPFFLGMSCHLAPLSDPQVRRAVALGINKPEIVRVTYEVRYHRQLLHSFIPSKLPGFYLTDEMNTYSLPQARGLLEESGLSPENLPEITLLMEQPRTEFKHRLYLELRRQLSELGIRLREEYFRSKESVRNFRRPYLILSGQRLDFPGPEEIIRPLFASDSAANLCRYSNAELDGLLLKAEQEKSWSGSNRIFVQIQKILNREMPAVPLFTQQNRVAVQPFVKGIKNPPLGFYYLKMENIRVER